MKKLAMALGFALMVVGLMGQSANAQLQLPTLSVSPASHDFGSVPVGALATGTLTVTNTGGATLNVTAVKTRAPFGDNATSFTLAPGASREVLVSFAPSAAGVYSHVCTFLSNAGNGTVNVPLSGTGTN